MTEFRPIARSSGILGLALGMTSGCATTQPEPRPDLIITNARIITEVRAIVPGDVAHHRETAVIENGSIRIRGDRIVEVLAGPPPLSGTNDPAPFTVDVGGATVLPGFVDAHTHLLERIPVATSESALDEFLETTLPGILRGNLEAGVTTMVSMGDFWPRILTVQKQLREGALTGPRLHVMGPAFEGPGGHPAETICGGDAWCRATLAVEVDDPAVAAERARAIAETDVMGLKVVYSGAIERTPGEAAPDDMDPAVFEAIAGAANERGLRVAVHENFADRALDAIERGARVLAHTPYSEPIAGTALLDRLVADRVPMVSTLWVAGPPLRDPASHEWQGRFANRKANAKALLDAGGLVVFGTDNAFIEPGEGMRLEIEALTAAGFAPTDVIEALTRNGAEFLGLEAEQGTIEVSKIADLVVVRGDPLEDISNLMDVVLVVKGGEVLVDRLRKPIATDVQNFRRNERRERGPARAGGAGKRGRRPPTEEQFTSQCPHRDVQSGSSVAAIPSRRSTTGDTNNYPSHLTGTRRFSSSCQLSTTWIWVGAESSASTGFSIRKRSPSGLTS